MKYLILFIFCHGILNSIAQISSGTRFLGGGVAFNTQSFPEDASGYRNDYINFSISPVVGIIINGQWAFGGQLGFGYSRQEYTDGNQALLTSVNKGITLGAAARRFFPLTEKFYFALDGQLFFNRGYNLYSTSSSESKTQSYEISPAINPVFIFFPSERWGFEASIGSLYYGYSRSLSNDSSSSTVGFNYGTLNLGFAYYFTKK